MPLASFLVNGNIVQNYPDEEGKFVRAKSLSRFTRRYVRKYVVNSLFVFVSIRRRVQGFDITSSKH